MARACHVSCHHRYLCLLSKQKMKITAGILRRFVLIILSASLLLYSCQKTEDPGEGAVNDPSLDNIIFEAPNGWPAPVYSFSDNQLSKEGFRLGRELFFDPILSSDNKVSCGSCHQPFAAFAQLGHAISHGVADRIGTRNSPPLFNLSWHLSFFWDGGIQHMEDQPEGPITNPLEMDETLENIVRKLRESGHYRNLFREAFGTEEITDRKIFKAMAQFMGMMVSAGSKYDRYISNPGGGIFTEQELNGLQIFRDKCAGCHKEPLFSDFSLRNNGLSLLPNSHGAVDLGAGTIHPEDSSSFYKFKVPSLRNLRYTAPYMHDGRFITIDEVLDHYSSGIQQTLNLDVLLTGGLSLSAGERQDLKIFLNTLDDENFVTDVRFKEPR